LNSANFLFIFRQKIFAQLYPLLLRVE